MEFPSLGGDIYSVVAEYRKKIPNLYVYLAAMPSCCSAITLSGALYREVDRQLAQECVEAIVKVATNTYSFMIVSLLLPTNSKFAEVLLEAGFEESQQVARSNDYNGSMPLRVYIRSMRPMTEKEVADKISEYGEKSKKDGYNW